MQSPYGRTFQLSQCASDFIDAATQFPLVLSGTVKLHGSNISVLASLDGEITQVRSRRVVLSLSKDLFGATRFMDDHADVIRDICESARRLLPPSVSPNSYFRVTGEFCGPKIQKGVAVTELSGNNWFVFDVVAIDDAGRRISINLDQLPKVDRTPIHLMTDFPTFELVVQDLDDFGRILDEANALTVSVETQCPVGAQLGLVGLGEGIVWIVIDDNDRLFRGKTKAPNFIKAAHGSALVSNWRPTHRTFTLVHSERLDQARVILDERGIDPLERCEALPVILEWLRGNIEDEEKDTDDVDWTEVDKYVRDQFVFGKLYGLSLDDIIVMIARFEADNDAQRLVFPRSLSIEDRANVFKLCNGRALRSQSYGEDDERYATIQKLETTAEKSLQNARAVFLKDFKLPKHLLTKSPKWENHSMSTYDTVLRTYHKHRLFQEALDALGGAEAFMAKRNELSCRIRSDIRSRCVDNMFSAKFVAPIDRNLNECYLKRNIYQKGNDGKEFVSVDICAAHFTAIFETCPDVVAGCGTWKDFVNRFTNLDYFAEAKHWRHCLLSTIHKQFLSTKALTRVSRSLIREVTNRLAAKGYAEYIVHENNDEVILRFDDTLDLGDVVPTYMRMERFQLRYLDPFYAKIRHDDGQSTLKCVSPETKLHVAFEALEQILSQ
jgi:hypothetical protein